MKTSFICSMLPLLLAVLAALISAVDPSKCGYQSCPVIKENMLNVHLIAHTHDDVGWLKTFDQYYYGDKTEIARAGVQYILDSVIEELQKNPERRFIYVETAFFNRWWIEQNDSIQQTVKRLVQNGQLEFIGGGWSMNDEAAAHYNDVVDQMTVGLRTLKKVFGDCGVPKVGWQIDPFGHSREQASLFAQMGFDGLFLGRIDYQDKRQRLKDREMEFVWNGSSSLSAQANLFTGILFNTYSPPDGFCFDLLCDDEPIIDNPTLPDYNVKTRIRDFISYVKNEARYYISNNIPVTMGNDFNYQQAGSWFKNLDKLIKYVNALQENGTKINVLYSTPSCYLKALHDEQLTWSTKSDDFFPYASDQHSYWTGYFTSRPALKGYIRRTNNFLQICKQLDALTSLSSGRSTTAENIQNLKEAQGVNQHHDAVTGTSKQAVQNDYVRLLYAGASHCEKVVNDAYSVLMAKDFSTPSKQHFCHSFNVSKCLMTENNSQFEVTIYNPLGRSITHPVRLPITGKSYVVKDYTGKVIDSQIVPIPNSVLNLPERTNSSASEELVFLAELPPMGFATYFVTPGNYLFTRKSQRSSTKRLFEDAIIASDYVQVTVDGNSGLIKQVINLQKKIILPVSQTFHWYRAMNGNNMHPIRRASGAYIFRPNGSSPIAVSENATGTIIKGPVVNEIHQIFNSWVTQVIRLYKNSHHVEMEWLVGPIPVQDRYGKEIINRFDTQLNTEGVFYTDANGREILKRKHNHRDTWHYEVIEEISGNYYPIVSQIYMKDSDKNIQLAVLTDRSVGGGSLKNGSLEVMVHRRLLHDDAFGVGEALNEPGFDGDGLRVRGKTWLILDEADKAIVQQRELAQRVAYQPLITIAVNFPTEEQWNRKFQATFSGLNRPLPPNVHLLTLETLTPPNELLLRLEHYYERHDPANVSHPATVNLYGLFSPFTIESVTETRLAADRPVDSERMQWKTEDNSIPNFKRNNDIFQEMNVSNRFEITLHPMEIKTFIIKVKASNSV